jgi:Rrf2 family protein
MTAQEEYGLRCLLRLAQAEGASLTIPEIARHEAMSASNVAKMLRLLRRAGLVQATRGKDGGYLLARPPADLNVGHALGLLGGRLFDSRFCDRHAGLTDACTHSTDCAIRGVWQLVQGAIDGVLGRLTLADLLRSRESEVRPHGPRSLRISIPVTATRS